MKTQDRLIQDETRRKQGEFFTPTVWVNEAHKMIGEQFGEDWKEEYVVWDCAAGTLNLTRDYKFKELYCSTLVGSDIETANQAGYNPEAVKFQYDFLNDGIIDGKIDVLGDLKLPDGLKKAILEGKKIIFFINPPYGAASEFGESAKKDVSNTKINKMMKIDDWGASSQQLYAQFLYKLSKIQEIYKNINLCLFSPPLLLSGSSYNKFRINFLKYFNFQYGFLMNAAEFQDTSEWGLSFSIWTIGECLDKENFKYSIKENDGFKIINRCSKYIYNLDSKLSVNDWLRNNDKQELIDCVNLKSALNIKEGKCKIYSNSLGYFNNAGNNIEKSSSQCAIFSTGYQNEHGTIISFSNFNKTCQTFFARKTVQSNWINQKDEYLAPSPEIQQTEKYKQFEADSIVYSLFNTSSNQSSMRQVEYKDKLWDIKNEFFWMSATEMLELAETYKFDELYKDAKLAPERYVYNLLKTTNLSKDARELLEMSKELVRKSFEWRKIMHQTNPEYHLNAWDAGWYQIKKILNEHFKEDLATFNSKYKVFENRMRPQVYQLGFLKDDSHS